MFTTFRHMNEAQQSRLKTINPDWLVGTTINLSYYQWHKSIKHFQHQKKSTHNAIMKILSLIVPMNNISKILGPYPTFVVLYLLQETSFSIIFYRFIHLRVPDLQMSHNDLTWRQGTRTVVPVMATRATCPIDKAIRAIWWHPWVKLPKIFLATK